MKWSGVGLPVEIPYNLLDAEATVLIVEFWIYFYWVHRNGISESLSIPSTLVDNDKIFAKMFFKMIVSTNLHLHQEYMRSLIALFPNLILSV